MPIRPSSDRHGCAPCNTGSNSGRSASLFFLMISRARSRDSSSCTWLVTASASREVRSSLRSPLGRRKTFSRPSIKMRASDLKRGVIMLTMTSEPTSASSVGTRIHILRRTSACHSARRSRSPRSGAGAAITRSAFFSGFLRETGFGMVGALMARSTDASPLPARQNAKRIAYPTQTPLRLLNRID